MPNPEYDQPDLPGAREKANRPRKPIQALRLPMASGKVSALVLFACFALAAGLAYQLSAPLQLPAWLRWEIVVSAWWLVWLLALAHMLYRGKRLSDDHRMGTPRNWFGGGSTGWNLGPVDAPASADGCGDGCAGALAAVVAVIALVAAAWLIVEIVIPALAFVLYVLIRGMLARVVNDRHACTGNLGRSLLWGAAWATGYTAPLAALIWIGHYVGRHF